VAVKKIKADRARDKKFLEMVESEALQWCKIPAHTNILRFFGIWLDENKAYSLVSEFIADGSVLDVLHDRGFSMHEKYKIMSQAAAGLWQLHDADVVHRDLALRNILIDLKSFRVCVADFGLSREQTMETAKVTMDAALAVSWSSPEILEEGRYTKATDIWSFAVLAWELLAEKVPYKGTPIMKLIRGICDGSLSLPINKEWDNKAKEILKKSWNRNQKYRPKSKEIYKNWKEIADQTEKKESRKKRNLVH